jgi:AraC-like DNA-binding protein
VSIGGYRVVVLEESDIPRQLLIPRGPLARYIDRIFTLVPASPGRRVLGLPQGYADIVFRAFPNDRSDFTFGDLYAVGAQPRAYDIPVPDLPVTLIVRFRPGGAHPFFRVPMRELTDTLVPLQELWGAAGSDLLDHLLATPATKDWVKLAVRALHAQLDRAGSIETSAATIATRVADAVARHPTPPSVRTMADDLGMSERHLLRQFQETIGLSPKHYARIVRFERAISMASRPGAPGWAELSLKAGYYDQAHLIRDCQKLTGTSPAQFLSAWKCGGLEGAGQYS